MSPITPRIQIAQIQALLLPETDIRRSPRYLPRHERPPSPRALVVEQDAIARVHTVRLPVVHRDPVCVQLCNPVWTPRVERRALRLRRLNDFPVELRRRCLVEPYVFLEAARTDSVEKAQRAKAVNVSCILGHLERDLDV